MSAITSKRSRHLLSFTIVIVLLFLSLACTIGEEEPPWTPEAPRQYTAVTTPVEVYVLIDDSGNVVDFESPYSYGVTASLTYVLRFWDVGIRGGQGYDAAKISKAYTPIKITGIHEESKYSPEQQAEIYARTSFPTTEIEHMVLVFSGGPEGTFIGINPDTGKDVYGHMDWREDVWEMHVVFTEDIKQDYLVQGKEPFYNWP